MLLLLILGGGLGLHEYLSLQEGVVEGVGHHPGHPPLLQVLLLLLQAVEGAGEVVLPHPVHLLLLGEGVAAAQPHLLLVGEGVAEAQPHPHQHLLLVEEGVAEAQPHLLLHPRQLVLLLPPLGERAVAAHPLQHLVLLLVQGQEPLLLAQQVEEEGVGEVEGLVHHPLKPHLLPHQLYLLPARLLLLLVW